MKKKGKKRSSRLKVFIDRPVLSTVISILIVLLGVLGILTLPVAQYPDITPPTVQVTATYIGANADVVLKSVIVPLEEQINGVEGMTYMTSSSTNEGVGTIDVYFEIGTDPDMATVNVQNRVSTANSLLPQEVTQAGVIVKKRQGSNLFINALYSDKAEYDQNFLQNYAEINIIPQLKRIKGVGDASAMGRRLYAMRIWLKPDRMSSYGLTPADVSEALANQNIEAAPGKFGENGNQSFQYVIKYTGRLSTVTEFENIIVNYTGNGNLVRLKDIARIELGAESYNTIPTVNGKPSVNIAVNQIAGANAKDVIEQAKKVFEEAEKAYPSGIHNITFVDINTFLDASISKVIYTLIECFLLVFLVIFIFLQDFRSTIIHGISVPVSITGTFFFLQLLGYSINLLTLFAMVLAIGIVVDDAIVVVEAVHAKLESGYKSARKAAIDAMSEISSAIISITLVMSAVFIPVSFMGGSSGVFYKQFGITLAIAIIISAVNALTLCPALAALFLRAPDKDNENETHKKKGFLTRFGHAFNAGYDKLLDRYKQAISFFAQKKWLMIVATLAFALSLGIVFKKTPASFVPAEDMGTVFVMMSLPPASALERTTVIANEVDSIIRSMDAVNNGLRMVGRNNIAGEGSSYAMEIVKLKHWKDRKGTTNEDFIEALREKTAHIQDAKLQFVSQPTITGFGASGGFELQLQDQAGNSISALHSTAQRFITALNKRPEIQQASTSFDPNFPQYQMEVNVPKAQEAGIAVSAILEVMQAYYGGLYASNYNQFGKQYRVMMQADSSYRANIDGLKNIFVRTDDGLQMAPISEFINLTRVYGPESIARFNMFTAVTINGTPDSRHSSGEALLAITEVAQETLPDGYGFEFSGISREEQNSSSQSIFIFSICIIFVYFLLCAQYESYILPLAILLSLPVGLLGVLLFANLWGLDNNIYIQITLIMLIGLLSKNAILIVEFALQRRRNGLSIYEAALQGAEARLRPILMTSFAFIFGLLPLLFSSGAGAKGNISIGVGSIGGMLMGTLLGIFMIPILFIIFQGIQEWVSARMRPEQQQEKLTER